MMVDRNDFVHKLLDSTLFRDALVREMAALGVPEVNRDMRAAARCYYKFHELFDGAPRCYTQHDGDDQFHISTIWIENQLNELHWDHLNAPLYLASSRNPVNEQDVLAGKLSAYYILNYAGRMAMAKLLLEHSLEDMEPLLQNRRFGCDT